MRGFKLVNLMQLLEEVGEDVTKDILSSFSCPLNSDVEIFLRHKAIEFSRQGLSQTHLVFASYKEEWVLVAYFTLANKYISVSAADGNITSRVRKRISRFSVFDKRTKTYHLSAPLIAQLGKNFSNGYHKLISGDELLDIACEKVKYIQLELGGRFVYLECEDKPKLIQFYQDNGFFEFDKRPLDRDEAFIDEKYLVQMLRYMQ